MFWQAVCVFDSVLDIHSDVMDWTCASGVTRTEVRMRVWRRRVLATEAKKAESASEDVFHMPRPPIFTGSETCVHCISFRDTFRIFSSPCRVVDLQIRVYGDARISRRLYVTSKSV